MQAEYLLFAVFGFLLFYFGIGPGSRKLKKKSHHYIVPPLPHNDTDWLPIETSDYQQFIFIKSKSDTISEDDILTFHKDVLEIEIDNISFKNNWYKLKLPPLSFSDYHYIIPNHSIENDGDVYGFAKHKTDKSLDYFTLLNDSDSDYLDGVFRNETNFSIYIPHLKKHIKGNISKSENQVLNFAEIEKKKLIS